MDFDLGLDELVLLLRFFSRAMVTVDPGHFMVVLGDFGSGACM